MGLDKQALDDLRIDRGTGRSRGVHPALVAGVVLVLALAGGVYWWVTRPKPVEVLTIVVSAPSGGAGSGGTTLNASGYVTARNDATVSSKVTGKVIEVLVEEGMRVEAGQVLARLDASNTEKSLLLSKAQAESMRKSLDETVVNLEQSERELRRIAQLASERVASQSDLERAEAETKALRARLERQRADVAVAESEVALYQQHLEDMVIRAPFSGIVTSKNAQPGEMISPMSAGGFTRTGICTIVDMKSLEIEVDVSESYINRVEANQPAVATLDAYPEWRIPAKVIAIIPTADRQKATVKVRVGFEEIDSRVLPQMGVKVAFQRAGAEVDMAPRRELVVPKSAVHKQDGRDVVWLVREGRVERRAVTVGGERVNEVVLAAGLSGGEKLVVEGAEKLKDGAEVTEAER